MLRFTSFTPEHLSEASLLLIENRVEWLKKNVYQDNSHGTPGSTGDKWTQHENPDNPELIHEPHKIIDHFAAHDPDEKKGHTQWMVNQYRKQHIRQEDAGRVGEDLRNFMRYRPRLENKDINAYKHAADLGTALEPHLGGAASNKEEKRELKHQGADLVHREGGLTVHRIKNREGAQFYGAGTKWCTTQTDTDYFSGYHKQGPLYVVNTPDKDSAGRQVKYQLHFHSGQFADPTDKSHPLGDIVKKYPGLKNVREFKGMHPTFDTPEEVNANVAKGHTYPGHQNVIEQDAKDPSPKISDHTLRQRVAALPRMPATQGQSTMASELERIAKHPNASAATLHDVHETAKEHAKGSSSVAAAVASHPNTSDEMIGKFVHESPAYHEHVIKNPNLSSDRIRTIHDMTGSHPHYKDSVVQSRMRESIAAHPSTPPDILHDYVHASNHLAASKAVNNPNTAPHTFESAMDRNPALNAAMAKSKVTPPHVLEKLASADGPSADFIRDVAAKNLASRKGKKK